MKAKRYWLLLSASEERLLITSLIRMKNKLIQQGRYTDCLDELIAKICIDRKGEKAY